MSMKNEAMSFEIGSRPTAQEAIMANPAPTSYSIFVPAGTIVERRNSDGSSVYVTLAGSVSIDWASRDKDGSYLYTVGRNAYRVAAACVA